MSLATNKDTTTAQVKEPEKDTTQAATTENGLPKTQEELDAIIEARVARERKKMAKQQQGQTPQKNRQGKPAGFFIKLLYYRVFLQATLLSLSFLSTSFRVIWSAQSQVFAA